MHRKNAERAARAAQVIMDYRKIADSGDDEAAIQDLMSDLGHFCDLIGQDVEQVFASAMSNYRGEQQEPEL